MSLSGREREISILEQCLKSPDSELVAILGRRRTGKTALICETFKSKIDFAISGLLDPQPEDGESKFDLQLRNFSKQLESYSGKTLEKTPDSWVDAFDMLSEFLSRVRTNRKKIVFFDEFPWLATARSGFLECFSHFWNDWAERNHVLVIICGSATSWMLTNVIKNKGGLHNRVTQIIKLKPFSLRETFQFFKKKNILKLNNDETLQLYMVLGGVPAYLQRLEKEETDVQSIIEKFCFSDKNFMHREYSVLLESISKNNNVHRTILEKLAEVCYGLTRQDIVELTGLKDGGSISRTLQELEDSDLIAQYQSFGKKKKSAFYRLTDHFVLFYLRFAHLQKSGSMNGVSIFENLEQDLYRYAWANYAFKNICLSHQRQIKEAMGISAVYTKTTSFIEKRDQEGDEVRIDMLLDRNDNLINICEIKYRTEDEVEITPKYASRLRNIKAVLKTHVGKTKQISFVIITTTGLRQNANSLELVTDHLNVYDLFS